MVRSGYCSNCGVLTRKVLCDGGKDYRRCMGCYRHLPDRSYPDADSNVCAACQCRNPDNVGRYCLDSVIARGTEQHRRLTSVISYSNTRMISQLRSRRQETRTMQ